MLRKKNKKENGREEKGEEGGEEKEEEDKEEEEEKDHNEGKKQEDESTVLYFQVFAVHYYIVGLRGFSADTICTAKNTINC